MFLANSYDTTDSSQPLLKTRNGYYYGTEKGGDWWKRYSKEGWFSRGNAVIWVNQEGIYFRRYLTRKIMHIPTESITKLMVGSEHGGKWFGCPTIKVHWKKDNLDLVSGFSISWKKEETEKWVTVINGQMNQVHDLAPKDQGLVNNQSSR
jgi:hypothetical protein